jgi:hypothetical protein
LPQVGHRLLYRLAALLLYRPQVLNPESEYTQLVGPQDTILADKATGTTQPAEAVEKLPQVRTSTWSRGPGREPRENWAGLG